MFSAPSKNKNKNVMSMFTKSPDKYSVAMFTRPGAYDPTGMRAEFLKAGEEASKRADPTGMRAEFMKAATKKGGKRRSTRRRRSSRRY